MPPLEPVERYAATRDRFAAAALKVLLKKSDGLSPAEIVTGAYDIAELMMLERAKRQAAH